MNLLQHGTCILGIDSNEEYECTGEYNKENYEPVRESLLPCVPSAHHRGKAMTNPAPRKRRGPLIEVDAAITTPKPMTARALSRYLRYLAICSACPSACWHSWQRRRRQCCHARYGASTTPSSKASLQDADARVKTPVKFASYGMVETWKYRGRAYSPDGVK